MRSKIEHPFFNVKKLNLKINIMEDWKDLLYKSYEDKKDTIKNDTMNETIERIKYLANLMDNTFLVKQIELLELQIDYEIIKAKIKTIDSLPK